MVCRDNKHLIGCGIEHDVSEQVLMLHKLLPGGMSTLWASDTLWLRRVLLSRW